MSANIINQVAFLRTSREFPEEIGKLTLEVNKSYVDIAGAVNDRIIGLFPVNRPAITGESWYLSQNRRQQTLRQVYTLSGTSTIPHGLNFAQFQAFSRMWGEYTDTTNWYGLIAGSNTAIAGQQSFYVTPTNIVIVSGAGAPTLSSGIIVLEYLSLP